MQHAAENRKSSQGQAARYLTQPVYIKEPPAWRMSKRAKWKSRARRLCALPGDRIFVQHIRCEENGAVHDISQCRRKPEQLNCFDNLQVGAHRGETDPYE